jgi:hypothetical protein
VTPDGRDRLASLLGRHYALGRFEADELERRLDLAYGAEDAHIALDGLPPLPASPEKRRFWGRRHGERDVADPSWVPTKERFVDPSTGRVMRVWVDPGDHSRHYVPDRTGL